MKQQQQPARQWRRTTARALGIILVVAAVGLWFHFDMAEWLKEVLADIRPAVFIGLMAIMPALGAPVWVFLVLVGMKFGILEGIMLSAVLMFFHMTATFFIFHSFLRERVARLLFRHFDLRVPEVGETPWNWKAAVFIAVPGVPYALKNCLLAMAGLPFAPYMTINWGIQYGMSLPMIVLGDAMLEMDFLVLAVAAMLAGIGYLVRYTVKKRAAARRKKSDQPRG